MPARVAAEREAAAGAATVPMGCAPERPWLASYPAGVPSEIAAAGTLVDLFDSSVRAFSERPALESFGVRMSYGALARRASAVAGWLQRQGIGRGDRVALMMPNVMAYPAALFGALMSGAAIVNVNPLYTPRELTAQLRDCGARILFVLENFAHTVEACGREIDLGRVVLVSPGDLLGLKGRLVNLVSRHVRRAVPAFRLQGAVRFAQVLKSPPHRAVPVVPEDVAFLQYTGGTTGTPKGATLTHGNVAANVAQCEAWLRPGFAGTTPIIVTALPLYHIFALTACCMVSIRLGGCQLLIANPRDIAGFVRTLASRPFTCINGVNTLFNALVHAPGIGKVDFSRLTLSVAGGMATQKPVADAWRALTGRPIVEGYGLSETSPVVCVNRLDLETFTGTIGFPLPSTEVSIRGPDREEVEAGVPGELCVRGPQVMRGYWNRPEETAAATTEDGYFRTGDVALMLPDGAIRIVDRMKDMVLVSGFNVYPNEVEEVISGCPGVREVAVVGIPSEKSGESVLAAIVRDHPGLSPETVRAFARERLAPYKVPHEVVFRETLPKSNVGKVLRRMLRGEILAERVRH